MLKKEGGRIQETGQRFGHGLFHVWYCSCSCWCWCWRRRVVDRQTQIDSSMLIYGQQ